MKRALNKTTKLSRGARLAGLAVVAAAVVILAATSIAAGGEGDAYRVRADFLTSAGITTGADVRVAGANVGSVEKIFVTNKNEAAVVVAIVDPAFQKFYADASCRIRLQSLIGEKFIECDPGTVSKPELDADPGDSSRKLVTSKHTRSPVDTDELLDAMREPERERFRIIMNELGITLAGRGQDLQDIIDRFDPTLKEVNQILKILAKQNKNLVRLAEDGDASLQELAANRKHITGLFREADKTARAVNEKQEKFEETLALIPAFLDELEPTAAELRRLAEEAAPVASSAKASAKDLSTFVSELNDFANAANPALKKLGDSTDVFREQLPALQPVAEDLARFGSLRSSVTNIRKLLESFDEQGGYYNLSSMAYGVASAANGYDAFGHFLRSAVIINSTCLFQSTTTSTACGADFTENRNESNLPPGSSSSSSTKKASTSKASTSKRSSKSAATSSADRAALDYLLGGE
ncbi:MAG: MCE family protein [Actinobacteria bacterium]|nr:MCE family protein [Actinomycetota bacterium]